jgi:hypothetical protein
MIGKELSFTLVLAYGVTATLRGRDFRRKVTVGAGAATAANVLKDLLITKVKLLLTASVGARMITLLEFGAS